MRVSASRFLIMMAVVLLTAARPTTAAAPVLETFEGALASWSVVRSTTNGGSITQSSTTAAAGTYSARLATAGASQTAQLYTTFSDAASSHTWRERPGTWRWQRAAVYVPSATVAALGSGEYLTLAGLYASANPTTFGWYLRLTQSGEMQVVGTPESGSPEAFRVYGTFPTNQWVELEIGLHSQQGDGVKRAFAFLVNGAFYGWYRQGRMTNETYDRAALGLLNTNSPDSLVVYVDQWRAATTGSFPDGPDSRSTAALQEQNFRTVSGVQVQYDWSTWTNTLVLHPTYGLYSSESRLQAGRNLDRMPSVANGWGEIEIDWPNGTPPACISNYCAAMVGFRKEVNREENLEVVPITDASGTFYLWFQAWAGTNGPVRQASWRLPDAHAVPGRNLPEPGDIIRARWEAVSSTQLRIRASYYDASAGTWFTDVIDHTFTATNVSGVNYMDGYHEAASITIDSRYYSIRRFRVGTLTNPTAAPTPQFPTRNVYLVAQPVLTWSGITWAAGFEIEVDRYPHFPAPVFQDDALPAGARSRLVGVALPDGVYYWRVRAKRANGAWAGWSAVDSFVVKTIP